MHKCLELHNGPLYLELFQRISHQRSTGHMRRQVTCSRSPLPATILPSCTGLSSYYALDITDAQNPKLLWEFSHPFLGYTYSGPAVIHKWSNPTYQSGDQYYVMFLSGPTNGTDGSSIQDVQAFVLTLNANLGISSVYYKDFGSHHQERVWRKAFHQRPGCERGWLYGLCFLRVRELR